MRRILVFHPSDDSYGIDRVLVRIAATLRDAGYEVECVLDSENPGSGWAYAELTRIGAPVTKRPLSIVSRGAFSTPVAMLRWLLEAIARLPSLIRMGRTADIVYVNSFVLVPAALAARLAHRTVVWHLHEIPPASRVAGRIVRLLSTRQICVSHAVAAALGLSTSTRCVVLHNAVDLPRATVSQPPATIDCPLEVGIVARINQGKGHLVLADAFMELLSEDQPIRLHIVGGPHSSDTTVASELERRLSSVPRERIVWAGDVPSGSEYMRALHVLAAPSVRPDPFPLSVLEGMAAGLVVVASDAGGHPEAIQDNRTGLLCAPGDSHQLAAKIRGLVTDLPRRVALSAAARTFVTAEMSPEAFREGLRGAIDDV